MPRAHQSGRSRPIGLICSFSALKGETFCEYQTLRGKEHVSRCCGCPISAFKAPAHALPYIRVGVRKSASFPLLNNLLLESILRFCSTSEPFGEGAVWRILIIFYFLVGFPFSLFSISFAWVVWLLVALLCLRMFFSYR